MPELGPATPVLRSFDAEKARELYVDFLGFEVEFEHRLGPKFPLYMGLALSACRVHLTEHHGDACPGAHVRIQLDDIRRFLEVLQAKDYMHAKPGGPEATPWGTLEAAITDPFGNRLTFVENKRGHAR